MLECVWINQQIIGHVIFDSGLGMVRTLSQIYNEEGLVRGLYRGMSINYLRAIPMVAVSFTTYELMKQLLQLDTGIKME